MGDMMKGCEPTHFRVSQNIVVCGVKSIHHTYNPNEVNCLRCMKSEVWIESPYRENQTIRIMRTIDKYLTEAKVELKRDTIKKIIDKAKTGSYDIGGEKVSISMVDDTMIWKYPSEFYDLTYVLIDLSDEMGYNYQQLGMNTKKDMKFIIDKG